MIFEVAIAWNQHCALCIFEVTRETNNFLFLSKINIVEVTREINIFLLLSKIHIFEVTREINILLYLVKSTS